MILVVDVGNTNLTWGVYDKKELKATFRMTTKTPRTSDEYGVLLTEMLRNRGIDPMHLEGSIVASVVPDIMHALLGAISRYTNTERGSRHQDRHQAFRRGPQGHRRRPHRRRGCSL